jgi:glucokinase
MTGLLAGIDIGGTKCAVSLGYPEDVNINILDKQCFPTPPTPEETLQTFSNHLQNMLSKQSVPLEAIGISCGGPLDSRRGTVLSPPNLPGLGCDSSGRYFPASVSCARRATKRRECRCISGMVMGRW